MLCFLYNETFWQIKAYSSSKLKVEEGDCGERWLIIESQSQMVK